MSNERMKRRYQLKSLSTVSRTGSGGKGYIIAQAMSTSGTAPWTCSLCKGRQQNSFQQGNGKGMVEGGRTGQGGF